MKKFYIIFLAFFSCSTLFAQERVFTYTYQSSVQPKGKAEIEVWSTLQDGRTNYYYGIAHRLEFEMGLGGHLQTSVYLNYGYSKGIEDINGFQTLNSNTEYSFSNEWKYQFSKPERGSLGSALYFEYLLSPSKSELEGKLILDKELGKTIQAFNLVGEYGFHKSFSRQQNIIGISSSRELTVELNYGFAYRLNTNLIIGWEIFNQNQFSENYEWENSVLSMGPAFSYSAYDFNINLTLMPQIANLKGGGRELSEHEKLQVRLILSYDL